MVLPRRRLDADAASVYLAGFQWERYREVRRQARFVSETRSAFVEKGERVPVVVLEPERMGGEALVAALGRARPAVVLPIDVEDLTNLVLFGSSESIVLSQECGGGIGVTRWLQDGAAAGGAHAVVVAEVRKGPGDQWDLGEIYGVFECGAIFEQTRAEGLKEVPGWRDACA